jgi:TPR repeat protein
MYEKGQGVPQNYIQAHMWYNLAATQGNEIAKENRDIVAKRMTPAQIAEAQELARKWFKEHSE